jgi:hypothetical protein
MKVLGEIHFQRFVYEVPNVGTLEYSITCAQAAIDRGAIEATVLMTEEQMRDVVAKNEIDHARLDDVDPAVPGIGAPIVWEGAIIYILIDGSHRCARALRDGTPFRVHLLTDQAAADCLVRGVAALLPPGATYYPHIWSER